ncbi:hypothetical protein DPX16_7786 [Anabarilius grahami]|uniref:Uncharacterized protein n=1 Tax=Anabarilius grahami TaxID=495550 RepID=A0A3N0XJR1_ANAGA|nr:hypothetical protein DPX16_7786 [Anabarilius grahami]
MWDADRDRGAETVTNRMAPPGRDRQILCKRAMLKGFFTAWLHIITVWWWLQESSPHTHTQSRQTQTGQTAFLSERKWVVIIMGGNGEMASRRRARYGALISLVTSEFLHVHAQIYKKLQVAHLVLASQSRRSFFSERRTGKCARKRERGGRQKGGMGKNDSVPKCPVLLLSNNSNACLVLVRSVFLYSDCAVSMYII